MKYVAFLRGINVGGRKSIKMADLRRAFESMGFAGVRTVQASGNVLFEAPDGRDPVSLPLRIAEGLEECLGLSVKVLVRPLPELQTLVASDPFADVPVTPETRLYVTFLCAQGMRGKGIAPQESHNKPDGEHPQAAGERPRMVKVTGGEVLTAIRLSPGWGTPELMLWLERELGPDLTTRSWNTLIAIVRGEC